MPEVVTVSLLHALPALAALALNPDPNPNLTIPLNPNPDPHLTLALNLNPRRHRTLALTLSPTLTSILH